MGKSVLLIFLSLISSVAFSQKTGSIQGNISDAEMFNEPLMFAQLTLKNSSKSVQTNLHGNYEFSDIDPGEYTLTIGFLGYETVEIPVTVEKARVTRIDRSLAARKIDISSVLSSDTASDTSSYHSEITGPDK